LHSVECFMIELSSEHDSFLLFFEFLNIARLPLF